MQIIIRRKILIPNGHFIFVRYKNSKKKVHSILFFCVSESIAVVSSDRLCDIIRSAGPFWFLAVGFDAMDELWSAVLESQGVPVVLEHGLQSIITDDFMESDGLVFHIAGGDFDGTDVE